MSYSQYPPQNQPPPPGYGFTVPPAGGQDSYGGAPPPNYGGAPPPMMPPPMHAAYPPAGAAYGNVDAEGNKMFGFDDKAIRAGFIRKVFFLLTLMLLIVVAMVAVPIVHEDTSNFVRTNSWLYFVSYAVFLIVYLPLMCCENVRRSFPVNLVLLFLLTLAIGYMTMMITAFHKTEIVFLALTVTTVVCGCIILFSMQTKYDFTKLMGVMFVVFMVVFVLGIVAIIAKVFFDVKWLYLVYAGAMALVFCVFLAIDVQMVMGGKKFEISPEDYIFAAIQLFLDIVYIFWFLLQILGAADS